MTAAVPIEVAGYEVGELLYENATKAVYRAVRSSDKVPVVVKVLRAAEPTATDIAAFKREFETNRRVASPNIIEALAFVRLRDRLALVFADVRATPLRRHIEDASLSLTDRIRVGRDVASALAAAHAEGLVHNGVSPANVLVSEDGPALLIDFGHVAAPAGHLRDAIGDWAGGDPVYASPEQTGRMNRGVDHRSDLYSLGVTLYELFSGQLPFRATDPLELAYMHIARRALPLGAQTDDVPPIVSDIVMKLLRKEVEDRYQTAAAVVRDMDRCLDAQESGDDIEAFSLGEQDVSSQLLQSQSLFGRDEQLAVIVEHFERASGGDAEMLFIHGASGTGKSALAAEAERLVVSRRGYFITGKFDQAYRDQPHSGLASAFQSLARIILAGSESQLEAWRDRLKGALGGDAGVLVEMIPDLQQILGETEPVAPMGAREAKARFSRAFRALVRTFTEYGGPLVVFLDDLQWADPGTLEVIRDRVLDRSIGRLLLIGAYRRDELPDDHPLISLLRTLAATGKTPTSIELNDLERSDIEAMLSETLARGDVSDLSDVVYERTGGNPYFAHQLVDRLHEAGIIRFDHSGLRWSWDIQRVRGAECTGNVVDFLTAQLRALPELSRQVLGIAALVGNRFFSGTVARVGARLPVQVGTAREVFAALLPAVDAGYLLPQGGAFEEARALGSSGTSVTCFGRLSYRFPHDRVQQAATVGLEDGLRRRAHLALGETLLLDGEETLFGALSHLHAGWVGAAEPAEEERYRLAELNRKGGEKARASGAFRTALTYFDRASQLLPADAWDLEHRLAFGVRVGALECEVALAMAGPAEARFSALRGHARRRSERARLLIAMINLRTATGDYQVALDHALKAMEYFDLDVPSDEAGRLRALNALVRRIERKLGDRDPSALTTLPDLEDSEQRMVIELLMAATIPGHVAADAMGPLMTAMMLDIALEYGVSSATAFAVADYGRTRRSFVEDSLFDPRWHEVPLMLLERFPDRAVFGKMTAAVVSASGPLVGLERSRALVQEGYEACVEHGDIVFAALNQLLVGWVGVLLGGPLPRLRQDIEVGIERVRGSGFVDMALDLVLYRQYVLCHLGETEHAGSFDSGDVTEADLLNTKRGSQTVSGLRVMKSRAAVILGGLEEAWETFEALVPTVSELKVSTLAHVSYYFDRGIAAAQLARTSGPGDPQRYEAALVEGIAFLEGYARVNPADYRALHALLLAEQAALEDRRLDAMHAYEDCLSAAAGGSLRILGLANELAGRFYSGIGFERIAGTYLASARRFFKSWGSRRKTEALSLEFGGAIAGTLDSGDGDGALSASLSSSRVLDYVTVLRAAQALSSETHMERLFSTFLRLQLEGSGADRVIIFAPINEVWHLVAERKVDAPNERPAFQELESVETVARSVVDSVRRTQEVIIVGAKARSPFNRDPYLADETPRSILCVPCIHMGDLVAVVYLENLHAEGVFTPERVEVVEMLSSQSAIAISNARLMQQLRDTTAQLKRSNRRLEEYTRTLERDAGASKEDAEIVGTSPAIRDVARHIEGVAKAGTPVLLTGEPGTGKYLFARVIHSRSGRAGALVKVDCRLSGGASGITGVFGSRSVKNSEDGRVGRVGLADGGTLFLDEVSELSLDAQAMLVAVVTEGRLERNDGHTTIDVRIVAATSVDLAAKVRAGTFRRDLYFALNVFPVRLPALRERAEDLPLLVDAILVRLARKLGKTLESVRPESMEKLTRYGWPGNVTELFNVLERAAIVASSPLIAIGDVLDMGLDEGSSLGSYRLVERIGAGGMGEVWRARHRFLRRPAAIKLIPADHFGEDAEATATVSRRFEREAQATAQLRSPHTVELFDYGTSETGSYYYVMELLEGLDLETFVERFGPMPAERVVAVLIQACRSLAEAHHTGLIHRDIKAANVYLCRLGLEVDFVKVLDFGLVRQVATQEDETRLTGVGNVGGTPAYMAPEQATDEADIDARADLYALGCLAFWLLTGQLVFEATSAVKMMLKHLSEAPEPPSHHTEMDVPSELDALVLELLSKDPTQRPGSARELARRLARIPLRRAWDEERAETWWSRNLPR